MPINGFVANYSDKIIVHSLYAKEELVNKRIHKDIKNIMHYANIEPLTDMAAAKSQLGFNIDKVIISSFGFIAETKRVFPIIKAFKNACEKYCNLHLCFVGKAYGELETSMKEYIEQNDLNELVTITGYTDLDSFKKYIEATDICLNLRYPYNGETSGSLMRILSAGKCVVVNNIGSFGEIPDEYCIKLQFS